MIVKIKNTWTGITLLFALVFGGMLSTISTTAQATPAFARSTGAACNKCHSVSFPRLNEKGERFMRNGFQMPGSSEEQAVADLEGEEKTKGGEEKKKVADDLFLGRISEIFSVTGNLSPRKIGRLQQKNHRPAHQDHPACNWDRRKEYSDLGGTGTRSRGQG